MFTRKIAVMGTDRESWRDGNIGETEARKNSPHQLAAGMRTGDALIHIEMENCPTRVEPLEFLLMSESFKGIICFSHRKLCGIGVIGPRFGAGVENVRELHKINPRKAMGSALCRRGLEIIEMTRPLLILRHAIPHMLQKPYCKLFAPSCGDIFAVTGEIADTLIDSINSDGGKMVSESAKIALGVRKESLIHVELNHLTLQFETLGGQVHEPIKLRE
jgi:hypothetical protein